VAKRAEKSPATLAGHDRFFLWMIKTTGFAGNEDCLSQRRGWWPAKRGKNMDAERRAALHTGVKRAVVQILGRDRRRTTGAPHEGRNREANPEVDHLQQNAVDKFGGKANPESAIDHLPRRLEALLDLLKKDRLAVRADPGAFILHHLTRGKIAAALDTPLRPG